MNAIIPYTIIEKYTASAFFLEEILLPSVISLKTPTNSIRIDPISRLMYVL